MNVRAALFGIATSVAWLGAVRLEGHWLIPVAVWTTFCTLAALLEGPGGAVRPSEKAERKVGG